MATTTATRTRRWSAARRTPRTAFVRLAQVWPSESAMSSAPRRRLRDVLTMSATEIHSRMSALEAERMLASLQGLTNDPAYMADLTEEITAARHAYVGAAVTE